MTIPAQVIIQPGRAEGTLWAPPSKSMMQRACAIALIHAGETRIHNPGYSFDDQAALGIIQDLGVEIIEKAAGTDQTRPVLRLRSMGKPQPAASIHAGESGLSIRMFTPVAAMLPTPVTITGSGSLVNRPMDFFEQVLPQWGASIQTNGGKLPLMVQGPLKPTPIEVDGSLSSQFISGLFVAASASIDAPLEITVTNPTSKPYIDLTLDMLAQAGYQIMHTGYTHYVLSPRDPQASNELDLTITGDWSGAAFPLVAAAIAGKITLKGLDVFAKQADRQVVHALMQAEALLSIREDRIECKQHPLQAFHFNATDCPDLFPPLAVLAACAEGTSVIEGVHRLTHKESNRALTIQEELGKMGVTITLQDDLMIIEGGSTIRGGVVHSHHDHRIAMACAVLALRADGPVTIEAADAVGKSYPRFYEDIQRVGVVVGA